MTTLKTMMAALLAGSLLATAGGFAYAKTDGSLAFDPAQMQQRLEKRVDQGPERAPTPRPNRRRRSPTSSAPPSRT